MRSFAVGKIWGKFLQEILPLNACYILFLKEKRAIVCKTVFCEAEKWRRVVVSIFFSGGCHRLILRYIYIGLSYYLFREDEINKRG